MTSINLMHEFNKWIAQYNRIRNWIWIFDAKIYIE